MGNERREHDPARLRTLLFQNPYSVALSHIGYEIHRVGSSGCCVSRLQHTESKSRRHRGSLRAGEGRHDTAAGVCIAGSAEVGAARGGR
jgi:hypothetical protein